ncbi:MAG TPA: cytochrome c [Xanthobacteraceae bacterium]|nr:cytochrome c [Xanthobacteraceae bacterium]
MRRTILVIILILIIAVLFAWRQFNPGPLAFAGGSTVALSDYKEANPTGVPASLANAGIVKRGEYLARAADCMACHTASGGQDYAGGLAIELPFGTIYSTNITPDKDTGIGDYSDQDFLNAIHRGIRKDGTRLYPAMPYPSYTYMTDADALAIKAYLFSLPPMHVANKTDTLTFPYNQRWAMAPWSFFFNADTRFAPNTAQTAQWNRGAYLAEALAHCGECHTPRNVALALDNRRKFAGAVTAGWRAYNITSDKGTGIGAWSDDEVFDYLAHGHAAGRGTASGPMGEAVDASFSHLEPEDIHALVTYLRSVPPIASPDLPATLAPAAPASPKAGAVASNALGKKIFAEACASCHSWSGVSALTPFATIAGARAVNDPAATNVAQIVISGTRRHEPDGAISMPAFGSIFSDTEIAAVVNYVTARFGSVKSSVTESDIAALRKQASR